MRIILLLLPSVFAVLDCVRTPKDPECVNYKYPNASIDVVNLCEQMPFMSGCSLKETCTEATSSLCSPFGILASICQADMPRMKDCRNYASLCQVSNNGDLATFASPPAANVKQCSEEPPVPYLPATATAGNHIKSICSEMSMVGCDKCKDTGETYMNCDVLSIYSYLCKSMPEMHQCSDWKQMCTASPFLSFCSLDPSSTDNPPTMKMFFQ